ncbi:hypothetical protein B566_EDAN014523 [Ephemera danica]|nr:hypothetical protein B566_EDAN014523 [Ephemera danica]
MASPTPSLESLPGANSIASLIVEQCAVSSLPSESPEPPHVVTSSKVPVTVSSGFACSSSSGNSSASSSRTVSESGSHSGSLGSLSGLGPSSPAAFTKCFLCNDTFCAPKVLPCFHTFCQACLEKHQDHPEKVSCPQCKHECILPPQGIAGLLSDYAVNNLLEAIAPSIDGVLPRCTGCKSKESSAVGRCLDCANYLCPNCVMAHQFMHCFEGHRVLTLGELAGKEEGMKVPNGGDKTVACPRHKGEPLKYFCKSCSVPVCQECTLLEHPAGLHDCEHLAEAGAKHIEHVAQLVQEGKAKATDLRNMCKNVEHTSSRLQVQYHKAQNEINETFQFYRSMIDERKQEVLKELESVFNTKHLSLSVMGQKVQEKMDKINQTCEFIERMAKHGSATELLMFKKLLDSKLQALMSYSPDVNLQTVCDLEFVSNYQAIQVGVRNTFGYVRSSSELPVGPSKQPPIARPTNGITTPIGIHLNGTSSSLGTSASSSLNGSLSGGLNSGLHMNGLNTVIERPYSNSGSSSSGGGGGSSLLSSSFESNILSKRFSSAGSLGPFSTSLGELNLNGLNSINPYEKWSNGGSDSIFQNGGSGGGSDQFSLTPDPTSMLDLTSKLMSTTIFPPKSQIKRQKMIYHCKFGEFGVMEGQFTEPSGVAVNAQNDIIVADTNNHRIQIFDKEGRFKFQFGECGKRDGQLLYPNRVAVVRPSGDIIVTERSPTHQIQIYNQYGQFVRKFGANILQHPRGVTVDSKGRIVVVECKVMRVIIFDQAGNVLQKFGCSKHLEFPNGVVVNDKQEIFISDNRAHCVKVFNYEGTYLRQIGGEGITNYPIGVGINANGEILIADNHNNFNLTIFTQDGTLVSALESKVKHAQCFDVALMDDGSVVLASKDYRLYIYRYVQVPPIGL